MSLPPSIALAVDRRSPGADLTDLRRAAAFVNVGILVEQDLGAQAPQITILKKKGRRIIENSDEIFQRVTASLPDCRVVLVEGEQIATMSIHDQVACPAASGIAHSRAVHCGGAWLRDLGQGLTGSWRLSHVHGAGRLGGLKT